MIGALDPNRKEATIIGAGISGLLAAYQLDREGYEVTVLEAETRSGGLIRTLRTPLGIAECAAHSLLGSSAVLMLLEDLEVEYSEVRPESRARFIWRQGKPRRMPLRWPELLTAAAKAAFARAAKAEPGLTLEAWGARHLGKAALEYGLDPLVRGIYGARPSEISVSAAFPALRVPEGKTLLGSKLLGRKHSAHSRRKRRPKMIVPRMGMESLIQALERRLKNRLGDRFRMGETVSAIPESPNVILCLPAYRAATLLANHDTSLSECLNQIRYVPLVSVTAFVPKRAFSRAPRGVGVLVPENEGGECLGVLFNSSSFEGRVEDEGTFSSFTLMFGGTGNPAFLEKSDTEVRESVIHCLGVFFRDYGFKLSESDGVNLQMNRWNRAIPLYDSRILAAWETARQGWCSVPGRLLFGNYTGQVSIRGMIESVKAWEKFPSPSSSALES